MSQLTLGQVFMYLEEEAKRNDEPLSRKGNKIDSFNESIKQRHKRKLQGDIDATPERGNMPRGNDVSKMHIDGAKKVLMGMFGNNFEVR